MPAALVMLTLGGMLIYSGLKGVSFKDMLEGLQGTKLDSIGGAGPYTGGAVGGVTESTLSDLASVAAPGLGTFDGKPVANWIIPILTYARAHGWAGQVTSGYRSAAEQARVCSTGVKPCATPGTSNHQGRAFPSGAVDVTNAPQLASIIDASKYRGELVYAGAKDPVHFSHPHNGSY